MTPPRCAYNRHCNEETVYVGPDGPDYCSDHYHEIRASLEDPVDEFAGDSDGQPIGRGR
jgi:hypothetical protein